MLAVAALAGMYLQDPRATCRQLTDVSRPTHRRAAHAVARSSSQLCLVTCFVLPFTASCYTPQGQSGCDAAASHSPLDVSISRVGLLTTCFTVTSDAASCNPYFSCCTPDALTQMDQLQIYTSE